MEDFSNRGGTSLEEALDSGDISQIERVTGDLVQRVWAGDVSTRKVDHALSLLRDHRHFALMVRLADAAITKDPSRQSIRQFYCQALVELEAFAVAETQLRSSLEGTLTLAQRSEVLGLLGRISKDRFLRTRSEADLDEAQAYYEAGWDEGADPIWHGVNLLALQNLSHRLDPAAAAPADPHLARKVLNFARDESAEWAIAGQVEALLALDDVDGAEEAISRFVADTNMFHVHALQRQLVQAWGLDETDRLLLKVGDKIAGSGHFNLPGPSDDVDDGTTPVERFEKIFAEAKALRYHNLADGLAVSQSVGKMTDASGRGIGTAFLVRGDVIHDSLGPDLVLVTNAHVISAEYGGALPASEAQVRFDVTKDVRSKPLVCHKLEEIWSSPMHQCDVTLLKFESPDPDLEQSINPAQGLPSAIKGTYVTVIGHPAGGELSLSLRGNDLIEYDEAQKKMHYLAPTEPGSSGSPVFDENWELIGVHHAGHQNMPRLAGVGFHAANEATTLDYIRSEFARSFSL